MTALIVLLVIVAVLVFWLVSIYNQLVTLKARFENAFSQIEVQLKRRYDLIPNLVETAKGYLKHESETLTKVTEARNQALASLKAAAAHPGDAGAINALGQAERQLTTSLAGFNLQVEAYPELKANQNMMQLSEELTATENRVAFARQAFNDAVTSYNIYRKSFPNVMVANNFGHTQDGSLLEFEDSAAIQAAPKVSF
ncbi:LemA family protein [Gallaecimonas kandeliae]|uniref:LemA family protein n=1 Tax=Gallaecimonas kandeliae TaxID=3029055 RepID=UPI0026470DBC|nr:LemA family protein [Gallaecimonas kandeliae]WKE63909.1 LemA family protein [Gallaecimonas kandeliae]